MARSLPHGLYSLLLVILAVTGWFFSLWQGDGCNYAIVSGPIVDQLDPSFSNQNPITTLELGFDSYRELPNVISIDVDVGTNNDADESTASTLSKTLTASNVTTTDILRPRTTKCILYPEEVTLGIIDSSWTTSRSFAFFGLVLGGAGTTFLACSLCFVFSRVTWRWTGYALELAALFQTLSLVTWFRTQLCSWNTCGWSLGSISDVCAVAIWALAGGMILCHYPSMRHEPKPTLNKSTHKSSPSTPSTLADDDDSLVKTHHSCDEDDDEETDPRRFPLAEIA